MNALLPAIMNPILWGILIGTGLLAPVLPIILARIAYLAWRGQ